MLDFKFHRLKIGQARFRLLVHPARVLESATRNGYANLKFDVLPSPRAYGADFFDLKIFFCLLYYH
jgi:hypothetical protein